MKKGRIYIYEDRCKGCGLCIAECRKNEISESNELNKYGYNVVKFNNLDACNACRLCAVVCPDAAIKVCELVEVPE
ncbi:MAG: ferredoxin family protein [Candidatus Goldiibacteriota bacterium]